MKGTILLLPEQCEPMDEFHAVMRYTKWEMENFRGVDIYGQGFMSEDILDKHRYLLEEVLYPLVDECNGNDLNVKIGTHLVEITVK